MMIDRYAASKYTEAFPGDMYPASHSGSNVSVANDNQDYKVSSKENYTVHVIRQSFKRKFVQKFFVTEKAPTRSFSWLKAATTAFTIKTLLRIKTQ